MNTDIWEISIISFSFMFFFKTRPFLQFFLIKGGTTWTSSEFGQFAEFFMETLVQGTQATQAKVPKWC